MVLFSSLVSLALYSVALASSAANNTVSAAGKQYDYIVVGSGAGGGPLAARLALGGFSVLLLEAGDDQGANRNEQIPAFHPYSTEDPNMAWNFFVKHYADPARAARDSKMTWDTPSGQMYIGKTPPAGSKMRGILYPRSGTLGGCSAHNAMVSIYPHNSDWQNIADITGDQTWAPANMRKYFERLEDCNYCGPLATKTGKKGWLSLERADVTLALGDSKLLKMITKTATAVGSAMGSALLGGAGNALKVLDGDINSGSPDRDQKEGVFQIPLHTLGSKRVGSREFLLSVAKAVNKDGSKAVNLDIQMNTLVTKVLFTQGTTGRPRASGVSFLQGKSLYRADPRSGSATAGTPGSVYATREVILSGGAYNTPQMLKLSGIGPRAELEKFKIPVVKDLPGVGTNLQDHFEVPVIREANKPFSVVEGCTFGVGNDPCIDKWAAGKGPYQSNGFFLAVIKKSTVAIKDPDLLMFGGVANFRGYYPGYSLDALRHSNWSWITLKAHTENRAGVVNLRSADPQDTPDILYNYFDTGTTTNGAAARDLQAMTEGIEISRSTFPEPGLLSTESFTESVPGSQIKGEEVTKQFIKDEAWGHHASCSAPIGADSDPMAVLDSRFRVRGVDGLRVVDASVFPKIPGFFVVIPTFMISEKAADTIMADAGRMI